MNENLRPVDGHKHSSEIILLEAAAESVAKAITEFKGEFAVAGRMEISHASRLLDRAFHGEAV